MKPWDKQEIEIAGGAKVMAQMPLIVSASRSTDVPAFYSDWFIERLGLIHLTTVTLAQGWDLENVIFICATENDGQKNTLENVLTGATRAKNSMRILDRTGSGWLYNELKDLSQL